MAHTSLEAYVRESVGISVKARNIDIRIQFSFPAALSLAERRIMDLNGDGALSKRELGGYLAGVEAHADKCLRLSLNGQQVPLIPLEDPVLDLQDAPGVEDHPHELYLAYFARVPKNFGTDGAITLDSGLWTDIPLMVSVSTAGAEGIRLETRYTQGLRPPSKQGDPFQVMQARCTRWEPIENTHGGKEK